MIFFFGLQLKPRKSADELGYFRSSSGRVLADPNRGPPWSMVNPPQTHYLKVPTYLHYLVNCTKKQKKTKREREKKVPKRLTINARFLQPSDEARRNGAYVLRPPLQRISWGSCCCWDLSFRGNAWLGFLGYKKVQSKSADYASRTGSQRQ